MNKMKMSAIVLGLAAAGAFAQNAPEAAPAAAPAQPVAEVNADSVKAAEEAKAMEAKKAEEEKAAAEAKKAEEEKAAAEAKKAEEEKAAEAKKAEEEKAAEAPAENTNPAEVGAAATSAFSAIKESFGKPTSVANMEVKVSGYVEVDAEANDLTESRVGHKYYTDATLNIDVKFNESWSAHLGIDAYNDNGASAGFAYDDAYVQYKPSEAFAVKVGDLRLKEGAFKSYYKYDDVSINSAGMIRHKVRGIEVDLAGLELTYGFSKYMDNGYAYDVHAAYEFNYAKQHLRPYFNYKSFQELDHNELHAGVDAGLNIGGFSFRAVYGFHMDYLIDDDDKGTAGASHIDRNGNTYTDDLTSMAHTFLAEPCFKLGMVEINTAVFFALVFEGDDNNLEGYNFKGNSANNQAEEIPEYFFVYAEPALKLAEFIKLGVPVEFHSNTVDMDQDRSTFDIGVRAYIKPVENLEFTAYGMIDIAIGDDAPIAGDVGLRFGLEAIFTF
ncbi:MAG: hypothetical protein HUK19_07020 [Fibrobacter sp.]|nr:hypothetical protein [Fibrobacter sp.]